MFRCRISSDGVGSPECSGFSPRSGRQHKAWGVSPRSRTRTRVEPAKRAIDVALDVSSLESAVNRSAGLLLFPDMILGLTPQALLRGLAGFKMVAALARRVTSEV